MLRALRDYLISFFIIGAAALLLLNYVVMPLYVHWNREVSVPNLFQLELTQAERLLSQRHLRWVVRDTVYRADLPAMTIMEQFPDPGSIVKEKRRIQLTISLPPSKVEMPVLVGLTERRARIEIEKLGLELTGIDRDSSDLFFRGVVMDQSIAAGEPVQPGDTLRLIVSLGKRNRLKSVPNLLNLSLPAARDSLREAGFSLGEVTEVHDSTFLPQTVIRQDPAPYQHFPFEEEVKVNLVISVE